MPDTTAPAHLMRCQEILGGNQPIHTAVNAQGLDAWLFSRPHARAGASAQAGGDVHFLTSCATGRITRLLLADVSGHGEPVAQAARELKQLLADYSNYIDQLRFIAAVNRRFGSTDSSTSLFATAVVATYFSPSSELTVCSAGHPPPLHFDASRRAWSALVPAHTLADAALDADNLPLGVDADARYSQSTVHLGPADLVLFFTDALTEARSPEGKMLGTDGLLRLVAALDHADPASFLAALLASIDHHRGPGAQTVPMDDDATAVLVRRNHLAPTPSIALGLLGAARVLRRSAASLLRGHPEPLPEPSARNLLGAFFRRFNQPSSLPQAHSRPTRPARGDRS